MLFCRHKFLTFRKTVSASWALEKERKLETVMHAKKFPSSITCCSCPSRSFHRSSSRRRASPPRGSSWRPTRTGQSPSSRRCKCPRLACMEGNSI